MVSKEPLRHCVLAIDQTGVGAGVVEMFRDAQPTAKLKRVLITSGHSASWVEGVWHIPKKELVASVQVVLQSRRITIPTNLTDAEVLEKELLAFRAKITAASNVIFEAWRERDHDDLVLSLAMAVFFAERAGLPCTQGPIHFSLPRKSRFIFPRGR